MKGPASVIRSFYISLPLALFFNALLFFRAVTLPGFAAGLFKMISPGKSGNPNSFFEIFSSSIAYSVDSVFLSSYGSLLIVGKFIGEESFAFPSILLGCVAMFFSHVMNVIKIAGFYGFQEQAGHKIGLFDYTLAEALLPVTLTQIPAPTLWLLVEFSFELCTLLPGLTFVLQIIVTSLREVLPPWGCFNEIDGSNSTKTRLASFVIPVIVTLIGFLVSLIMMANRSILDKPETGLPIYLIATIFILGVIVPLSLSKVYNRGYQTLAEFAMRHRDEPLAKILNIFSFVVGGIFVLALVVVTLPLLPVVLVSSLPTLTNASAITLLAATVIIILGGLVAQVVLNRLRPESHPWFASLGKSLES